MIEGLLEENCMLCAAEVRVRSGDAPPRDRVLITEGWRVTAHRSALPGWMLVAARSHLLSLADISADDMTQLGNILREGTIALVEEFGAEKSYVMQFSEAMEGHLHFSLVPRYADLPPDRLAAKVGGYNSEDEPLTDAARDEVAVRLSSAWPH